MQLYFDAGQIKKSQASQIRPAWFSTPNLKTSYGTQVYFINKILKLTTM